MLKRIPADRQPEPEIRSVIHQNIHGKISMEDSFKRKLTRGDLLVGTIVTLPSPEITESFCLSGFDWLFVDLEHSALSIKDAQVILQTAAPQIKPSASL
jgi:2-keto-3-deoxy-L-rhamnonate aldolase RhmA